MNTSGSWKKTHVVFAVALAILIVPLGASAQEPASEWQWRGSFYVWLPTISGTTQFPSGDVGPFIEVDADTLLSNLDFTMMGALEVSNGKWGGFTDVIYMNLGASGETTREVSVGGIGLPADVELQAKLDIKSWVWTLAATYDVSQSERNSAKILLGARLLDYEQTLDWTFSGNIGPLPLPGRSGTSVVDIANWDAIVGLKGQMTVSANDKWFIPYHFDVGTGDSDLTWQAMAGLGYRFGWGSAVLTWRHLDYEMESGSPFRDATFSGPLFGATLQW